MKRSTRNRALPMFRWVYFFKIMARMSVPPPDASILKNTAEANDGRVMANIISSTGSLVSGFSIGKIYSAAQSTTEVNTLT